MSRSERPGLTKEELAVARSIAYQLRELISELTDLRQQSPDERQVKFLTGLIEGFREKAEVANELALYEREYQLLTSVDRLLTS